MRTRISRSASACCWALLAILGASLQCCTAQTPRQLAGMYASACSVSTNCTIRLAPGMTVSLSEPLQILGDLWVLGPPGAEGQQLPTLQLSAAQPSTVAAGATLRLTGVRVVADAAENGVESGLPALWLPGISLNSSAMLTLQNVTVTGLPCSQWTQLHNRTCGDGIVLGDMLVRNKIAHAHAAIHPRAVASDGHARPVPF